MDKIEKIRKEIERRKEQDQPITGNSLEHEWLRYVDKKKKEYGGELPSLGEYGWLQIARHFAKWQKKQMKKDAVDGTVIHYSGLVHYVNVDEVQLTKMLKQFQDGDKVKVIIVRSDETSLGLKKQG